MKVKSVFWIFTLAAFLVLGGCSSVTFRMYPGPRLPKNQVSFLIWDSVINVIFVDGRLVPRCDKIELFPGDHNVQVGYSSAEFLSRQDRLISFTAEAGHQYKISHSIGSSSELTHWNAWVEDVTFSRQEKIDSSR